MDTTDFTALWNTVAPGQVVTMTTLLALDDESLYLLAMTLNLDPDARLQQPPVPSKLAVACGILLAVTGATFTP
jgi:hypothetical protein